MLVMRELLIHHLSQQLRSLAGWLECEESCRISGVSVREDLVLSSY